jgi:hypothetical protein
MWSLRTPYVTLPMHNVIVGAQFIGMPAEGLMQGNMAGFITEADADLATTTLPNLAMMPLSDLLDPDDQEIDPTLGAGWRLYFAFTAVPGVWTGPDD